MTAATETAVRALGTRTADASDAAVLKRVAAFMEVTGVGLDTVVPTDLASAEGSGSDAAPQRGARPSGTVVFRLGLPLDADPAP